MAEGFRSTTMPTASSAATDLMAVVVSEELQKKQAAFDRYPLCDDGLVRPPPLAADMRELESCFGHRKLRQVFETVDANNKAYAELHEAYKNLQHKLAIIKMRTEIQKRAFVGQLASQAKKIAEMDAIKEQMVALQSCTKCTRCSTPLPDIRKVTSTGTGTTHTVDKDGNPTGKLSLLQLTQVELQERTALAMTLKTELHKSKLRCQSLEAQNNLLTEQLTIWAGGGSHGSVCAAPAKSIPGVTMSLPTSTVPSKMAAGSMSGGMASPGSGGGGAAPTAGTMGTTVNSPLLGAVTTSLPSAIPAITPTPHPSSMVAHSAAVMNYFTGPAIAQTRSRDSVLYFKSDASPMTLSTIAMPMVTAAAVIKDTV